MSALLIVDFLPIVVVGIALGPLLDRWSRRGVLISSDLARAAVFCVLPFADHPASIVGLALVAGIATGFFRPAVYAGMPNLVSDEDLPEANSLLQTIENLAWTIGPVVGGILVAAEGPALAYWLNAGSFLVSSVLLARIPAGRLQAGKVESRGHWGDVADGLRLVLRSRPLLTVLVVWNVALLGSAGINVAEIVLAKISLDAGDVGFGLLVGATGVGLTLGSLAAPQLLERLGTRGAYAGSLALMGIGIGLAAVAPALWVAVIGVTIGAVGNGAAVVSNALLVQRGAPDRLRGRAFTVIMSSNYVVLGLGMVAAGALVDSYGARWVFGAAGVAFLLAAATAAVLATGVEVTEQPPRAEAVEPGVGSGASRV